MLWTLSRVFFVIHPLILTPSKAAPTPALTCHRPLPETYMLMHHQFTSDLISRVNPERDRLIFIYGSLLLGCGTFSE